MVKNDIVHRAKSKTFIALEKGSLRTRPVKLVPTADICIDWIARDGPMSSGVGLLPDGSIITGGSDLFFCRFKGSMLTGGAASG